jgi:hypothetical protein
MKEALRALRDAIVASQEEDGEADTNRPSAPNE